MRYLQNNDFEKLQSQTFNIPFQPQSRCYKSPLGLSVIATPRPSLSDRLCCSLPAPQLSTTITAHNLLSQRPYLPRLTLRQVNLSDIIQTFVEGGSSTMFSP